MFCILCHKLGLDPKKANLSDLKTESAQKEIQKMVFVTATDGNHGKGVSWAGGIFGCKVIVYLPAGSAKVRAQAIRTVGPAEVTITDMNYDQTFQYAMEQSKKNGWYLIQDTSWDDYEQIPTWIIQGWLSYNGAGGNRGVCKKGYQTNAFISAGRCHESYFIKRGA